MYYLFKGKSYLTRQLLLNHEHVFANQIKKFYYCFSHWQPVFDDLAYQLGSKIEFVPNFNGISFFNENGLDSRTSDSEPIAIILDDCKKMMTGHNHICILCLGLEELLKSKDALTIFTRYVHHKNCVFFLQTQVLLLNSDIYRSIVKVTMIHVLHHFLPSLLFIASIWNCHLLQFKSAAKP